MNQRAIMKILAKHDSSYTSEGGDTTITLTKRLLPKEESQEE